MEYKLTQYSHGAGCGCKISPQVLGQILHSHVDTSNPDPRLLVGNTDRDDAAVYDLGDGTAIISTTDFFMPIVDDPVDFGRIASVNAISDVYAMGGSPVVAIAILGWPIDKLPPEVAGAVMHGARLACSEAGIPLAGGHSIDSPEPIFGLAVTGRVALDKLKTNGGARPGDLLFLTKALGVGILSTAQKKGLLRVTDQSLARDSMVKLNRIGLDLAELTSVHALTDVTGFGLAGHLGEMCEASDVRSQLDISALPLLDREALLHYITEGAVPGGTKRNFASYGYQLAPTSELVKTLVCDPQTSGGLLVAVHPDGASEVESVLASQGLPVAPIGKLLAGDDTHSVIEFLNEDALAD